jgi:hypothetical protein
MAVYDKSAKRYLASSEFQPDFPKLDAGQYLNQLRSVAEAIFALSKSWIAHPPSICQTTCADPRRQQRYIVNGARGEQPAE